MFFHVVITYTKLPLRKYARNINNSQTFQKHALHPPLKFA